MKKLNEWVCTDPDNDQWGIKIGDGHYRFKEFDRFNMDPDSLEFNNPEAWVELDIILSHYTDEQIANHISAYYDSLKQLKEIYGEDSEWVIAECIFEQESGLY